MTAVLEPGRLVALVALGMLPGLTWAPLGLRAATAAAAALPVILGERAGALPWAVLTLLLATGIAHEPLAAPNHQFVLVYAALAVTLSRGLEQPAMRAALADSSRLLLAGAMGFATVHKLLAPGFADGAFFHFLLLEGGLANWLVDPLVPGLAEAVAKNREALGSFLSVQPSAGAALLLIDPWPPLAAVARWLAWLTLLVEGLLAALLLLAPRAASTHLALLGFAWCTFALRQENVFLAAVCALGLAACPGDRATIRLAYAASACVLLVLGLLGVRGPA